MSFTRSSDNGTLTVKDNEAITVSSEHIVESNWSGWPLKRRASISRSPLAVTPQSGLTVVDDSSFRYWYGHDSQDSELCSFFGYDAKLTIDSSMVCADFLNVVDQQDFTNTSGSTKTVSTNIASQVLRNGKKRIAGLGVGTGLWGYVRIDDDIIMQDGYQIDPATESGLSFNFEFCVREENVIPGDELTIDAFAYLDSNGVGSENQTLYDYDDLDNDGFTENDVTFTVPENDDGSVPDDLRISFTMNVDNSVLADYEGSALPNFTADADIGRDGGVFAGGSSVIEPCADNETPRWGGFGFGTLAS